MSYPTNCPDCEVMPGFVHRYNCDVERCSVCGGQFIQCACDGHSRIFARWSGWWPGMLEAEAIGIDLNELYAKELDQIFFVAPVED